MNDGFLSFARAGAGQRFLADVSRIANALVAIANKMDNMANSKTEIGYKSEKEANAKKEFK